MDAIDNLMAAAMGKGSSEEGSSDASFDPSFAGDYVMSSFVYRDDKAGVSMEIGRVTKVNDLQISYSDDLDAADSLTLGSINLSEVKEMVTLALYRQGEQIFVQTDLTSMTNYVAQKQMESYVYLIPGPENMPERNFENVFVHEEGSSPGFARRATSTVVDFLPYIGTGKAFAELFLGFDPVTGEEINRLVATCAIVGSFIPIPGAAKFGKYIGRALIYGGEYVLKNSDTYGKKILERNVKRISDNIPEFLKHLHPNYQVVKEFIEAGYKGGSNYFILVENRILHAGELIKKLKPDLQERLKFMRIPDKPLVPGGGLLKHEIHPDAHTIEKHVGKSDDYLQERSISDKLKEVSSFRDLEEAEYLVAETIKRNGGEVAKWGKNQKTLAIESKFSQTTGKYLKEGEKSIRDVDKVRVVLIRDESELGYHILTAFPIDKLKNG